MAKSPPPTTFHLFSRLPPELRDRIWFFTLPRRVVPLDNPLVHSRNQKEQQCWVGFRQQERRAKAPPCTASVCREARRVALCWGGVEDMETGISLTHVWIQRKLDTVLFGWTYECSVRAGHGEDMMELFLWGQRYFHPGGPVCLTAEQFLEFHPSPSAPEGNYAPYFRMDESASIAYLLRNAREDEEEVHLNADLSAPMDVDVAMVTIYIHATRADVLASQLFGRIADEPSQLVDSDDAATIAKFRTLFDENPDNQRRVALAEKFNAIQAPEFPAQVATWLVKVAWKLLAIKWLHEKQHNPQSSIYSDPMQVIDRPELWNSSLRMRPGPEGMNSFKVDHPWVVEETQRLPRLRPKIWFTYCTKDCKVPGTKKPTGGTNFADLSPCPLNACCDVWGKACVHSNQILVGASSYGRSIRIKDEHCSGPFCTFLGGRDHSQAYEGRCTGTGGYISNAEIGEIIAKRQNYSIVQSFVDKDSGSNIAMYGEPGAVDWVAYMDSDVKADRVDWIKQQNFRGFRDWAIDLESFTGGDTSGGFDPDDEEWGWEFEGNSACSDNPGSLQSIADSIDKISRKCASFYVLKENIDPKLDAFMEFGKGEGNEFFTCKWKVGKRSGSGPCTGIPHYWDQDSSFEVEYKLSDEDGFYKAASEKLGIDKDWIAFGDRTKDYDCRPNVNDATQGRPGRGGSCISPPCSKIFRGRKNVPVKAGDDKNKVGNPKEKLTNIMPNITALKDTLTSTYATVGLGIYDDTQDRADVMDAIVGYSPPILQLSESADSMRTIKDIGERANAVKKRNLIISIINYILMALPFVGEAVGPLVGSATDKDSAPFAILVLILTSGFGGEGRLSRQEGLAEASAARRGMKAGDLSKYTETSKEKTPLFKRLAKKASAQNPPDLEVPAANVAFK
ncbi:hypothetical protein LLEC1_03422 [Akanthomyces lecanii]|uniref:2EXR domain-containing protein n=1 Tax=Cordyceps confragosa TaxID=2714763 RepID=A0A179IJV9_CORDF|nr:hypothetical protein LLEC1_03422 [Akanthomyces lecanii]